MLQYDEIVNIEAAIRGRDKDSAMRVNAISYLNTLTA